MKAETRDSARWDKIRADIQWIRDHRDELLLPAPASNRPARTPEERLAAYEAQLAWLDSILSPECTSDATSN